MREEGKGGCIVSDPLLDYFESVSDTAYEEYERWYLEEQSRQYEAYVREQEDLAYALMTEAEKAESEYDEGYYEPDDF
jgi:hypothetical protein